MKKTILSYCTLALLTTSIAQAGTSFEVPNEFVAATPAVAAEVNENFDAVEDEVGSNTLLIEGLDTRLTDLTESVTTIQTQIVDILDRIEALEERSQLSESDLTVIENDLTQVTSTLSTTVTEVSDLATNLTTITSDTATNANAIVNLNSSVSTIDGRVSSAETTIAGQTTTITGITSDVADATVDIASNDTRIDDIENSELFDIEPAFDFETIDGVPTMRFSGVNLQLINGGGSTDSQNGRGNLILGYNETDLAAKPVCSDGSFDNQVDCENDGGSWAANQRSGSHSLIVGKGHSFTRHAHIVAGQRNAATGDYASVLGGMDNVAMGDGASVSAGEDGEATGEYSNISGGQSNTAAGDHASVAGGRGNSAGGIGSVVSGGSNNDTNEDDGAVAGGDNVTCITALTGPLCGEGVIQPID